MENISSDDFKEEFLKTFSDIDKYNSKINDVESDTEAEEDGDENYQWTTDDQSIANLTLLDVGSNSYLSNSIFGVKRDKIKSLDKVMAFIPNETRKVFLKYYSETIGHDAYWTMADRKAYVKDIQSKVYNLSKLL